MHVRWLYTFARGVKQPASASTEGGADEGAAEAEGEGEEDSGAVVASEHMPWVVAYCVCVTTTVRQSEEGEDEEDEVAVERERGSVCVCVCAILNCPHSHTHTQRWREGERENMCAITGRQTLMLFVGMLLVLVWFVFVIVRISTRSDTTRCAGLLRTCTPLAGHLCPSRNCTFVQ